MMQKVLGNTEVHTADLIALPRGMDKEPAKPSPKAEPKPPPKPAEAKLPEVKPSYPDCTPQAVPLDKVRSFTGTNGKTWGFTSGVLDAGVDEIVFDGGVCKFKVTSLPSLTFKPFVYTQANKKKDEKYMDGTDFGFDGPCVGKTFDKRVHITSEMSDRIRDAEIEHCNDHHRAFDLTYGKYIAMVNALPKGFPGTDQKNCQHTANEVFKHSTGFNLGQLPDKFLCLSAKTQLRDKGDRAWHGIDLGKPTYTKDCKFVDYTPDFKTASPEVGKHPSSEIITGCGVKE